MANPTKIDLKYPDIIMRRESKSKVVLVVEYKWPDQLWKRQEGFATDLFFDKTKK